MKYIIFLITGIEIPFLFADIVQHDNMASVINKPVVSAGYVDIKNGKVTCYGDSESLKIPSRIEDSQILQLYFNHPLMTMMDFSVLNSKRMEV
jgi:hypothetical protein